MRGIYSSGQEKILFMLDGHRLNSYCTNTAAPDFSIALEKLKQIEVLRGPASSLYGCVALTAVVNLITKMGADIDGVKAKVGIGNYGQYHGDLIFGKRYFDLDILLWGSFHLAEGQRKYVDKSETGLRMVGGDVTVGGIGNKPSYDFGTSIKYKNLSFLYNTQYSQVQAPMTMTHTFSPYDIERYKTFYGIRPSHTTMTHHADLSYRQGFGDFYLKGRVTYDNSNLTHYQVITELPLPGFMDLLPLPATSKSLVKDTIGGLGRYISGQEHTFGAKVQGD
jgi:iron complex outermembrane receptor protein